MKPAFSVAAIASTRLRRMLAPGRFLAVGLAFSLGAFGLVAPPSAMGATTEPSQHTAHPRPIESLETAPAKGEAAPPVGRSATSEAAGTAEGVRIYVDPNTGALSSQPTEAQRAALRDSIHLEAARTKDAHEVDLNESDVGLETFPVAGGVGLNLQGRFQSSVMLRRQTDGSFAIECTDDAVTESNEPDATSPPASDDPEAAIR